jgi:CRP/FNR family cyclic AMP-dependent transcriptional regulator
MLRPLERHDGSRATVGSLLDLDPGHGPPLRVRMAVLRRGPWDAGRLARADARHLGLLIVEGALARELVTAGAVSMELLGPGDLLRPWDEARQAAGLPGALRWSVVAETTVAVLDRRVAAQAGGQPEIFTALLESVSARAARLAVMQTIAHLRRVEQRVHAVLWHLADRWGRVTSSGVLVPLALSHRMLAQLVGARRPTVTTAVARLVRAGEVARADRRGWLLTGEPPER